MNICAFYNKIDDPYFDQEYEKIVDIWKKSWYDNGWNPIVLNLEDSKKHPKFDPSIQGSNPSMNRFQRPINGLDEVKLKKVKKYSYQAEIAADSIYRSGLDYAKELSMSNDIGALNDKNFSELPNEKRSKLKYFHSVIVNQLIEQAEKTKNITQLRMLIFIQENNVNIFNFSELLDIAQEYMDDSK